MAEQLTWFVGNRQPSISEVITANGTVVDLTASTVRFKMRPLNSATLKVDQPVSNTPGVDGAVRYDWAAVDVDTAGQYLVWWEVTTSSKKQDMNEAVITFAAHTPLSNAYVELEELKASAELTTTTYADQDLRNAIVAASRSVDEHTGQRFWADTVDQTRYYTASLDNLLRVDPVISVTSLQTDLGDDGTYENTWTAGTDYLLEPRNALADGYPYDMIRRATFGTYYWPAYPDSVKIVGKFGWPAIPGGVKVATTILAARYVKRMREAPFGIAGFDAIGAVVRISRYDPDVAELLSPYTRQILFA